MGYGQALGYCIQFRPYAGKDAVFTEYGDIGLGLGAAVVAHLLKMLPPHPGSNYHAVMDNFFTSTKLIRYLQLKSIAATGTVRLCGMENPPLKDVKMMEKEARGASDVAVDANINMAAVRWKDNKIVNVLSTFAGKEPVQKVKRYSQEAKKRIDIPQPKVVHVYNRYIAGVDRLDQNLEAYMINLRSKKWWWPLFRFCIDVAINNAYQLYRIRQLNEGESRMDALEFRREIVETYYKNYKTKNDSVALYPKSATKNHVRIWPKKITIGLGKERKDAALKMDVEALPNFSALNVMLDCILSVLKVFILNKRLDFLQIHGVVY